MYRFREILIRHIVYKVLCLTLKPKRMPRKFPQIILGVIYHPPPPNPNDYEMIDHITQRLDELLTSHPESSIVLLGDFNQLPEYHLKRRFPFIQIVKQPTMENNILDKIFTNADILYPSTQILPEIGTSDHKIVLSLPNPDVSSFNTHLTTASCVRQSGRNFFYLFF